MKYDIIIPTSYKDCSILKKNIPYIRKNLVNADTIFIILNKLLFSHFGDKFRTLYNVTLLDEDRIINGLSFSFVRELLSTKSLGHLTGWYFQQFLKMSFSLTNNAREYYLVWDSDTFPLNKIIFFNNNKRILMNPKKEHHQPYFDMIMHLLGNKVKTAPYSFISEHMMINTTLMKKLLFTISSKSPIEVESWWENIVSISNPSENQNFSEFETYGTFIYNYYPDTFTTRQLTSLRSGGRLFGRIVSQKELDLLAMDFDIVSFERGQMPNGIRGLNCKLQKIWIESRHKFLKR